MPHPISGSENKPSKRQALGSACYLLHAGFLFGLLFDSEDGGDMSLRNVVWLQQTTQRYLPEDRTVHNHLCENPKSYTWYKYLNNDHTSAIHIHGVLLFLRIYKSSSSAKERRQKGKERRNRYRMIKIPNKRKYIYWWTMQNTPYILYFLYIAMCMSDYRRGFGSLDLLTTDRS
jgi:hypothetical protein